MKITIYDGANTIGGNKIQIEERNTGIFLDFGLNFAKYGEFYQEYMMERAIRGIHDVLKLGLIPRINAYRDDLIPGDMNISAYPRPKVNAVFITHSHLDHFGNVNFLREDIAIGASATTLSLMKAMRDTASGFAVEAVYHLTRAYSQDPRILEGNMYRGRRVLSLDGVSDDLVDFLSRRPNGESIDGVESVEQSDLNMDFDVLGYEVDHSIYGAMAYKVIGDITVAYTGDLRFHGKKRAKTEEFVKNASDATILIIEGTRVGRSEPTLAESDVEKNALAVIENAKSLVIADFSPRNFERLEIFKRIAEKTSRTLVITAKDAYLLHALRVADRVDRMKGLKIYRELKAKREKWEKEVVEKLWGDLYIDPQDIAKNPENYILCFSFYNMKNLLDIGIHGGVYIYSSSEAFGEEQEFDFIRLKNWLDFFGFDIYGFSMDYSFPRPKPVFSRKFHSSGHLSSEEIRKVIEIIDPDYIVPVHTEHPEWFAENFENTILIENGGSFEV